MTHLLPLYGFSAAALTGGVAMLVARHPMRVALALISTMLSLAAIYATLGVHVIAVFQVLIYVGAIMVFMVFIIMLLDARDPSFVERYSRLLVPGVLVGALLAAGLGHTLASGMAAAPVNPAPADFRLQPFSVEFLHTYWLHFELTSVLLIVAVVAAIAVLQGRGGHGGRDG
ncbi:MAG TPA: NADH-quinone oxidoreductase subunit J [Steroidobacteraceae bacterium]|nr:NADH-quinone oxidoreductase subunit J [Steroidobacteraceae bacterium]